MVSVRVVRNTAGPFLEARVERLNGFEEPLGLILEDGLFAAQEQIVEGKGAMHGGSKWADMMPATIAKGRDPSTLLLDSGDLLMSLSRGGPENIFEVGPTEGRAGTSIVGPRRGYPYGKGQQEGAKNREPRPFLFWPEDRLELYDEMLLKWIVPEGDDDA